MTEPEKNYRWGEFNEKMNQKGIIFTKHRIRLAQKYFVKLAYSVTFFL